MGLPVKQHIKIPIAWQFICQFGNDQDAILVQHTAAEFNKPAVKSFEIRLFSIKFVDKFTADDNVIVIIGTDKSPKFLDHGMGRKNIMYGVEPYCKIKLYVFQNKFLGIQSFFVTVNRVSDLRQSRRLVCEPLKAVLKA